jgi:hypothetical protein
MLMNELSRAIGTVNDASAIPLSAKTHPYVRENYLLTKTVYRAQLIRRLAGRSAARTFLACMGVDAALTERVVSSSFSSLRR